MAIKSKTYAFIGAIITCAGFIALVLSFASNRWLESSNFEDSGFSNLGLWSICFDGQYRPPSFAAVSRQYEGCWWSLNKELDDMRSFLFPKWFVTTQVLVTVGLILVIFVVIMLVVNFINCFPHSAFKQTIKRGLALASSLLLFASAILLMIAIILFGVKASDTRTWIQNPDNNFLSWSFGMCILADFLFLIAGMLIYLQFLRLRGEIDDPDDSEPKVMLTNEPPPATSYRYAPRRDTASRPTMVSTQPAYAQRFQKNQPRGQDSLFSVSGAGEVYINRVADYEERYNNDEYRDGYRERGRNGQPPWHKPKTDTKINDDELDTTIDGTYNGSDYEKTKHIEHPTLPEYTPKTARKVKQNKMEVDSDSDNIDAKKEKKKKKKDNESDSKGERKSRSGSKKKRSSSRDRSRSGSRSRKKNESDSEYSEAGSTKKSLRRRSRSRDDTDDERSRSRRRSKRNGKSRSRSRDDYTAYSDSHLDSDTGSVRSRSKKKRRNSKKHSSHEDLSRKDKKRHSSSSKSRNKKNQDGYNSDEKSGSEYSHRRSRRREGKDSDVESKKRGRDFSETESVRSNKSRSKPKGTYSSYYE